VAQNPGQQALPVAIGAADPETRGVAAQRDDLDVASVHLLLQDPVHTVRERLAKVAEDVRAVAALARDPHPAVRAAIVLNSRLSDADLEMLARDPIAQVRGTAAASRRVSSETLTGLAGDRSSQVRWSVLVGNPERLDLARILAEEDPDEMNASQAKAQLRRPRDFTESLGDIELIT
jgi:hypothetical protein